MKRFTGAGVNLGFGLILALLVTSAVLSYRNTRQLAEDDRMTEHTHRVLSLLEAVLSTLKDAETGQRGFIITQDPSYLDPYHEAALRLRDELRGLQELLHDNPGQLGRLSLLEENAGAQLAELDRTISALKRTRDLAAAQEGVRAGTGKRRMDAARRIVAAMQQVERDLLRQRAGDSARSYQTAVVSNLITGGLAVALVSCVYYLGRRYAAVQREAIRRAEHLATLGKLLAGVVHEVRNPLAGIRSTVQLWERLPDTTRSPEALRAVIQGVDRLNELVTRLLCFARKDNADHRPVAVNSVLGETLDLIEAQAAGSAVVIERELDAHLPDVHGSASALRQVFLNLATNALQAMRQGGTLRCGTRYDPRERTVEVRFVDTGPGIPPHVLPRLFEPFFTTRPDGTGLGLALSLEFVMQHGGRIEVGADGPGATVRVILPTKA